LFTCLRVIVDPREQTVGVAHYLHVPFLRQDDHHLRRTGTTSGDMFLKIWRGHTSPILRSRLPLAFGASSPASQCFGGVNMRGFQGSSLVVVRKGLKLIRNCSVGHGSGDAEKSLRCL
jgi:hypothetical protein